MIRSVASSDAASIAKIYNHYIKNTIISFEHEPVSDNEMTNRINKVKDSNLPWLVIENSSQLFGYAYATQWNQRSAYNNSVEVTIYLAPSAGSKGSGTKLYTALFEQLRKRCMHTAIGGIALPNSASIALHEKMGMKKIAHYEQIGYKFNQWVDVGYWQIML